MRESPQSLREIPPSAVDASPTAHVVRVVTAPWGERMWLRVYCIVIAIGVLLSFTGAFGTGIVPLWTRLTYWLIMMLGGTVAVQLVSAIMDRFIRLEPLPEAIVQFVMATPFITVVVWLLTAAFNGRTPHFADLSIYIRQVIIITAFTSSLQYLAHRQPQQSHDFTRFDGQAEPAHDFRARLPFKFRQAEIHALSAEDHYLRVHTSAGETLILMRLYDAIRELDGIEGSQTHRSWWVAKSAVADVVKFDGRIGLKLVGGLIAPVSRSYQKALKDNGWL